MLLPPTSAEFSKRTRLGHNGYCQKVQTVLAGVVALGNQLKTSPIGICADKKLSQLPQTQSDLLELVYNKI